MIQTELTNGAVAVQHISKYILEEDGCTREYEVNAWREQDNQVMVGLYAKEGMVEMPMRDVPVIINALNEQLLINGYGK